MLIAVCIGALTGLFVGSRFKVVALVPAHGLGLLVGGGMVVAGTPLGEVLAAGVLASVASNGGYLLAAVLASPPRSTHPTPSRPLGRAPF